MKKKETILSMMMIICLFFASSTLRAQDYKHSIGAMGGTINGITYKLFLSDYFAFEVDASLGMEPLYYRGTQGMPWSINLMPAIMWQDYIGRSDLSWFIGLGLNGGYCFKGNYDIDKWDDTIYSDFFRLRKGSAKISLMTIEGLEYTLPSFPLTFQLDIRAGIGAKFIKNTGATLHIDLMSAFSIRYVLE